MGVTEASKKRMELAESIAKSYKQNPKVAAVVVAGSVSRGWADDYSDIEIHVFWHEGPSDKERMKAMKGAGGQSVEFHPYEDEEWSEVYKVNKVKIEVSQFLVRTFEKYLEDVFVDFEVNVEKQILISAVQNSIPLFGTHLIKEWKARSEIYSIELVKAMLKEHLRFESVWYYEGLAQRGDFLMLHNVMVNAMNNIYSVLHAVNLRLISHPSHKWIMKIEEELPIIPRNLNRRLQNILQADLISGIKQLQEIIEELFQIVERTCPDYRFKRPSSAEIYQL